MKLSMSNNGSIIALIVAPNTERYIYVSSDGGNSWRAGANIYGTTITKQWTDIDMAADGGVMVATVTNSEYIYISRTDMDVPNSQGKFWTPINELEILPGNRFWSGIALARTPVEPDEHVIAATATSDTIYIREPCDP
jgi:hypothetical protein